MGVFCKQSNFQSPCYRCGIGFRLSFSYEQRNIEKNIYVKVQCVGTIMRSGLSLYGDNTQNHLYFIMLHLLRDFSWEKEKETEKQKKMNVWDKRIFRVFGKSSDYSRLSNKSKDGIELFSQNKFPFFNIRNIFLTVSNIHLISPIAIWLIIASHWNRVSRAINEVKQLQA